MVSERITCAVCGGRQQFDTDGMGRRVEWCEPTSSTPANRQVRPCAKHVVLPWKPWIDRDPAAAPPEATEGPRRAAALPPATPARPLAPRCEKCRGRIRSVKGAYTQPCARCRPKAGTRRPPGAVSRCRTCHKRLRKARTDGQRHDRCFFCRTAPAAATPPVVRTA